MPSHIFFAWPYASCLPAFVQRNVFVNQLLQFIQFRLPDLQEPDVECLIVNPLDLSLLHIDWNVGARDKQSHCHLLAKFHRSRACEFGTASQQIDGRTLAFVGIRAKLTLKLRISPPDAVVVP